MLFDAEKYYNNKAFDLTEEQRNIIIEHCYDIMYSGEENPRAMLDYHLQEWEKEGILLAYDWVGHRNEWFFPTYTDALMMEDWLFDTRGY